MKLQVGEIRMDTDEGVSFAAGGAAPPLQQSAAPPPLSLDAIPRWAASLAALGAGGLAIVALVMAGLLEFWPLLLPVYLLGRLALYAGVFATAARPRTLAGRSLDSAPILDALRANRGIGVEALGAVLGWPERRVLQGLVTLVERGEVEEDLDVESGEWVYRPTTVLGELEHRKTLSATDRLRAIDEQTISEGVAIEN